jgi:hypothetical protein
MGLLDKRCDHQRNTSASCVPIVLSKLSERIRGRRYGGTAATSSQPLNPTDYTIQHATVEGAAASLYTLSSMQPRSRCTVKLLAPLDRSHDARGGMGPMTEATILVYDQTRSLVRTVEVCVRPRCDAPTQRIVRRKSGPRTRCNMVQHGATCCCATATTGRRIVHAAGVGERAQRTAPFHPLQREEQSSIRAMRENGPVASAASRSAQCLGYPPRLRPLLPAMPMRAVLNPPWPDSEPVVYCILHVARCDRAHASSGLESLKDLYRAAPRPRPGVVTPFTAAVGSGTKNTQPPQLFLTLAVSSQRRRPCLSPDRSA